MQSASKTNLKSLYNMFRQIPENNWHTGGNNFSVNLTAKIKGSKDIDPKIIDSLGPSIVLMAKVAHQTDSPEAFEYAILTKELPPIKLTQKEMQSIRGGVWGWVAMIAYEVIDYGVEKYTGNTMMEHAGKLLYTATH